MPKFGPRHMQLALLAALAIGASASSCGGGWAGGAGGAGAAPELSEAPASADDGGASADGGASGPVGAGEGDGGEGALDGEASGVDHDPEHEHADEGDEGSETDEGAADALSDDPGGRSPAKRYGALGRRACLRELERRKVPFKAVGATRGVIAPVRLTGPVGGVVYRFNAPARLRATTIHEIYDCRLVLALDDFAKILAKHDVVEVVHLSVYRPPGKKQKLTDGAGRRHGGALAIDAAFFKTKDGRTLDVTKDWGPRTRKTCPPPAKATELRAIACEANEARIFSVLLTPNFNKAHRNHFHLEVTAKVKWFYLR